MNLQEIIRMKIDESTTQLSCIEKRIKQTLEMINRITVVPAELQETESGINDIPGQRKLPFGEV